MLAGFLVLDCICVNKNNVIVIKKAAFDRQPVRVVKLFYNLLLFKIKLYFVKQF